MLNSNYLALSAQVALERRLTTIAHNLANHATSGFRAEEVRFSTVDARAGAARLSFVTEGSTSISRAPGETTRTDNPFDVAIRGDGWIAVQSPQGLVYTRDGRMQMLESGALVSLTMNPVLDASGAPIQLDPAAGPPHITNDGMITQSGRQIGAIGLFSIPDTARLARAGDLAFLPDQPATPVLDFVTNGFNQGFVEGANVNGVNEMTRLIDISRAFQNITAVLDMTDATTQDAIRTLGGQT